MHLTGSRRSTRDVRALRTALLCCSLAACSVLCAAELRQAETTGNPRIVEIPSGTLVLKGSLWCPTGPGRFPAILFNHGSGGEDAHHTATLDITAAAAKLAPVFVRHGYAFLYLYRRGQGLSADQAAFIQDRLRDEELAHGKAAREHLQFSLMMTEQLDDVVAGLSFLKSAPRIDASRRAVMGHSFGGQLTLLVAERQPHVRAAVTFAAAANSWRLSAQLRERLVAAATAASVPIMLIHAANDYDTAAGVALDAALQSLQRPHELRIYPAVGQSADDGHNMVYFAIPLWEADVLRFLDRYVKR